MASMKIFRVSLVVWVCWACYICQAGIAGNSQDIAAAAATIEAATAEPSPLPSASAAATATSDSVTNSASAGVTAGAASTTVEAAVSMDSEAVDGEATVETVEAETVPLGLTQKEINQEVEKISNEASEQIDSYSMYRNLMDLRHKITVQEVPEDSENLKMVKSAIKVVIETAFHSFINGFLPHVDRMRREADENKRSYLDGVVYVAGALVGKTKCSKMIACRTGKFIQNQIPGAQLAVMMAESMVPTSMLNWYNVFKASVIDRTDNCDAEYDCSLSEQITDESS